jgi:hypothetical protein
MVVTVMMVMPAGREGRACNDQHQNGGDEELLHAMQSSTILLRKFAV